VTPRILTIVVPTASLTVVAWWSGGYFPRTWGALLLAGAIGLAAVGIVAERVEVGRRSATLVGALVALAAWQVVTTAWAVAPDAPLLEAERTAIYATAALVALLAVPSRRAGDLVLAVLVAAGTATVTGLLAHALGPGTPDERLELPVGYPNASGILAATALVLGLGLTTGPGRAERALGGAAAAPAVVVLTLSLSRGSVLAAVLGVLVLCLVTSSRPALATVAIVGTSGLLGVGVVSVAGRLQDDGASLREGLALATVVALAVAGGWVAVRRAPYAVDGSSGFPRRRIIVAACVVLALGVVAVGAYEVRQSRSTPPTLEDAGAPNRLLSTSTSSRGDYWDVAARMVERHPLGGEGAGGFTRVWLQDRPVLLSVRDAHNLYLETLAELGPVGLALLVIALGSPLFTGRRAAALAEGRAAIAAYVALLAHAALDWDWELPAVTLCTLLLAVSLLRLGSTEPVRTLTAPVRVLVLGGATLLAVTSIAVHIGNGATADANDLLDRGDAASARRAAARAHRFRPWASEPWELMGEAELALGRAAAARADLRRAIRMDPRSWSAWLSLAATSSGQARTVAIARARALDPLAPEVETDNP
jgi:O-antigen ligase/polysaccharide polymerase Wzy-like membrane protein